MLILPILSKVSGTLAWLSMKRDGFEADKQDILVAVNMDVLISLKAVMILM